MKMHKLETAKCATQQTLKIKGWVILVMSLMFYACSENNSADRNDKKKDALKEAFPWFKDTGRTDDMTPIDIELFDERSGESLYFRIPKAYLTSSANWEGGKQRRIAIETGLPELKPRPGNIWVRKGDPEYDKKIEFFRNGLFIYLMSRSQDSSPQIAAGARKAYKRDFKKQDQLVHGLEYYKSIACSDIKRTPEGNVVKTKLRCRERTDEYFLTTIDFTGNWASFYCTRLEVNSGGGCQIRSHYRGRALKYIFRRSQLHRWQEFDQAVRYLLDQFYMEVPVNVDSKM